MKIPSVCSVCHFLYFSFSIFLQTFDSTDASVWQYAPSPPLSRSQPASSISQSIPQNSIASILQPAVVLQDVASPSELDALSTNQTPDIFVSESADGKIKAGDKSDVLVKRTRQLMDRMPMSFGKRDRTSEPEFYSQTDSGEDQLSRFTRSRLSLMPVSYGKRESDNFYTDIPLVEGKFPRESRGMLERMPLTYGKRDLEQTEPVSGSPGTLFALDARGQRIDNMPSFFGKREPLQESYQNEEMESVETGRAKRDSRMDRMPMAFGKRNDAVKTDRVSEKISIDIDYDRKSDKRHPRIIIHRVGAPPVFTDLYTLLKHIEEQKDTAPSGNPSEFEKYWVVSSPLARYARSRLGRMPMAFGKRASSDRNNFPSSIHDKRSRMDRMPISFGKRDNVENSEGDVSPQPPRSLRSRMYRMPMTYGKRSRMYRMPMSYGKRSRMYRMPMSYGKRSRMYRMPMSYGKRPAAPPKSQNPLPPPLQIDVRSRMERMPMAFGKRFSPDSTNISLQSRAKIMNRMPMLYGKRGASFLKPYQLMPTDALTLTEDNAQVGSDGDTQTSLDSRENLSVPSVWAEEGRLLSLAGATDGTNSSYKDAINQSEPDTDGDDDKSFEMPTVADYVVA